MRALMSVVAPAGNGTTMVTRPDGNLADWANAVFDIAAAPSSAGTCRLVIIGGG